ncbi:MAG: hypothetical protein SGJ09_05100 [Phycisphaerae bacterium]|nr:hypothetical protein [Phycisphaerae bacterium]
MNAHRLSSLLVAAVLVPAWFTGFPSAAFSGVKLIALPQRERVEIQLEVPGLTLIEEERTVPLAAGSNEVVFAWANAAIDKSTVQFRCLSDPDKVQVISVSYPPNENALTWQVSSPTAGPAKVRISYVIGGVDKSYEYRAEAGKDEKALTLWQYVELHNRTPEAFGESDMFTGYGERLERPVGANETRKILAARFDGVPIAKTYTADLAQFGFLDPAKRQLKIPMHYVLKNDATHGLGRFPLQPGKARIFQDDGHGTSAFLGEDWAAFAAKDDELKLFIGVAKDIVVTRTIEKRDRKQTAGPLSDYDLVVKYEIENFKDAPVTIDLAESMNALHREVIGEVQRPVEWVLGSTGSLKEQDNAKSTSDRIVFRVAAPPRGADQKAVKKTETLHVVMKNEW